jgi:dTDP-4-dehydrorhamnose 3,5-epimerase
MKATAARPRRRAVVDARPAEALQCVLMTFTFKPYGGLDGLLLVEGPAYPDPRGVFLESFRADEWARAGLPPLVQDNFSRSRRGVLRGLHFQKSPHAIGKLVRCTRGRVFDAAVDLRRGSPTYLKWAALELSAEVHRAFWIPAGFAHGFLALSDEADVSYKVTGYYVPGADAGLRWDDPAVGVRWPDAGVPPILSAKDAALPLHDACGADFAWKA